MTNETRAFIRGFALALYASIVARELEATEYCGSASDGASPSKLFVTRVMHPYTYLDFKKAGVVDTQLAKIQEYLSRVR